MGYNNGFTVGSGSVDPITGPRTIPLNGPPATKHLHIFQSKQAAIVESFGNSIAVKVTNIQYDTVGKKWIASPPTVGIKGGFPDEYGQVRFNAAPTDTRIISYEEVKWKDNLHKSKADSSWTNSKKKAEGFKLSTSGSGHDATKGVVIKADGPTTGTFPGKTAPPDYNVKGTFAQSFNLDEYQNWRKGAINTPGQQAMISPQIIQGELNKAPVNQLVNSVPFKLDAVQSTASSSISGAVEGTPIKLIPAPGDQSSPVAATPRPDGPGNPRVVNGAQWTSELPAPGAFTPGRPLPLTTAGTGVMPVPLPRPILPETPSNVVRGPQWVGKLPPPKVVIPVGKVVPTVIGKLYPRLQ